MNVQYLVGCIEPLPFSKLAGLEEWKTHIRCKLYAVHTRRIIYIKWFFIWRKRAKQANGEWAECRPATALRRGKENSKYQAPLRVKLFLINPFCVDDVHWPDTYRTEYVILFIAYHAYGSSMCVCVYLFFWPISFKVAIFSILPSPCFILENTFFMHSLCVWAVCLCVPDYSDQWSLVPCMRSGFMCLWENYTETSWSILPPTESMLRTHHQYCGREGDNQIRSTHTKKNYRSKHIQLICRDYIAISQCARLYLLRAKVAFATITWHSYAAAMSLLFNAPTRAAPFEYDTLYWSHQAHNNNCAVQF